MAGETEVRDGMTRVNTAFEAFDQADAGATTDQTAAIEANRKAAVSAAARDQARGELKNAVSDLDALLRDYLGGGEPPAPAPAAAVPLPAAPVVKAPVPPGRKGV